MSAISWLVFPKRGTASEGFVSAYPVTLAGVLSAVVMLGLACVTATMIVYPGFFPPPDALPALVAVAVSCAWLAIVLWILGTVYRHRSRLLLVRWTSAEVNVGNYVTRLNASYRWIDATNAVVVTPGGAERVKRVWAKTFDEMYSRDWPLRTHYVIAVFFGEDVLWINQNFGPSAANLLLDAIRENVRAPIHVLPGWESLDWKTQPSEFVKHPEVQAILEGRLDG